jgi:hypothetical protein
LGQPNPTCLNPAVRGNRGPVAALRWVNSNAWLGSDPELVLDAAFRTKAACAGYRFVGYGGLAKHEIHYITLTGVSRLLRAEALDDDLARNAKDEHGSPHPLWEGRFVLSAHWRRNDERETRGLLEGVTAAQPAGMALEGSG